MAVGMMFLGHPPMPLGGESMCLDVETRRVQHHDLELEGRGGIGFRAALAMTLVKLAIRIGRLDSIYYRVTEEVELIGVQHG